MKNNHISLFGGVYGDAGIPNWTRSHRTPLLGIASLGLRRNKWEGGGEIIIILEFSNF